MRGINKVTLLGTVCQDPVIHTTTNGKVVATFSLATNEVFTTAEGNREERAEFHHIVVWGNPAERIGQYVRKGTNMYVEGKIQSRTYLDKTNQKRTAFEIVCREFTLLPSSNRQDNGNMNNANAYNAPAQGTVPAPRNGQARQSRPMNQSNYQTNGQPPYQSMRSAQAGQATGTFGTAPNYGNQVNPYGGNF